MFILYVQTADKMTLLLYFIKLNFFLIYTVGKVAFFVLPEGALIL